MSEITVKRIDRTTMREQIQVYMYAFHYHEQEYEKIEAKWKIKHYENPQGESYVFGAYDAGKLVGMNCFMPLKYYCGKKSVNVVQSCESGVLQSHQRRGIWQQIMIYAEKYLKENAQTDVIIGFPNYENSYSGFLKLGYETLFFERNMMMICNGRMLAESVLGDHRWNSLAKFTEVQKSFSAIIRQFAKGYYVKETMGAEATSDGKGRLVFPVSQDIMAWKRYKSLRAFAIVNREKVVARFYGYEKNRGTVKYFMLSECFKIDEKADEKYCWATIIDYIGKMKYAFIRMWSNGLHKIPALGFIEMKKHKNPFIIKLLHDDMDFLRNPLIWDVGVLDLD